MQDEEGRKERPRRQWREPLARRHEAVGAPANAGPPRRRGAKPVVMGRARTEAQHGRAARDKATAKAAATREAERRGRRRRQVEA